MRDKLEDQEKELGTVQDKKEMLVSGKRLIELGLEGWIGRDMSGCYPKVLGVVCVIKESKYEKGS